MVPVVRLREVLSGIFTEDFCVCVILARDYLVPGLGRFVCGLLCELLCYCGLCGACRVNLHDAEV